MASAAAGRHASAPRCRAARLADPLPTRRPTFLAKKPFLVWVGAVLLVWGTLAWHWLTPAFVAEHCYYPLIMVLGAFVAGSTPQGGGAVAFPVLSVFLDVDRTLARDFSLMIQSIGMTSASVFLLSQPGALRRFRPMLWWLPTAAAGFVVGMLTLQGIRVPIIQALFLGGLTAFAIAYWRSDHRGVDELAHVRRPRDAVLLVVVLFAGGLATSLFGTGADILVFTLLVTWFAMRERAATELSIVLMASLSICGYLWRGLVEQALTEFQIRTWLTAVPVVLIMAPVGTLVLARISAEMLLRALVVLDVLQLAWFNLRQPSLTKLGWSVAITALAFGAFSWLLLRLARRRRAVVQPA